MSQRSVKRAVHKYKRGELHSGPAKRVVKSRKQAITIGSKAGKKGVKVPKKPRH